MKIRHPVTLRHPVQRVAEHVYGDAQLKPLMRTTICVCIYISYPFLHVCKYISDTLHVCIYMSNPLCCAPPYAYANTFLTLSYSQLQIGWHRILRLFLKLFQRTRILPMGFTISTK